MKRRPSAALGAAALALALLSGCDRSSDEAAAPPPPLEVSEQATGHYCGMLLADHEGPKGQIHLESRKEPVWFTSVRDTVAFLRLPEEPRDIRAIYVHDMARAKTWEQPEQGSWVDPRKAWFVIESERRGGMGAPEAVPFSDEKAAESFRQVHGGQIVRLDGIPDDYVLGAVDLRSASAAGSPPDDPGAGHAGAGSGAGHASAGHSSH